MPSVFMSYSRKDQPIIDSLVQELQALGLSVWIDRNGIRGGRQWRVEIVNAIRGCDVFLLCMSSASVASDNVRRELDIASGEGKRIIPLRLEKVRYPPEWQYQLAGVEWIDHQNNNWVERLLGAIDANKEQPIPVPAPQRRFPWGWAAAGMLIVGALSMLLISSQWGGQTPTPVPTHTSTATIAPTRTEIVLTSTASAQPATPTSTATSFTSTPAVVNIEEAFENNANNWAYDGSGFLIQYGKLVFDAYCQDSVGDLPCTYTLQMPFLFPRNFRMEIDASLTRLANQAIRPNIIISFRVRAHGEDSYFIDYYAQNGWYIFGGSYSDNRLDFPEETHPVLRISAGSTNRLGIEVENSRITPLVNGQGLSSGNDDHLSSAGDTYLSVVVPQGQGTTIEFDHLTVQEIE